MAQVYSRRSSSSIGPLQIAIIVLVIITALVHLQRYVGMSAGGFGGGPPGGGAGGGRGGFNIMQLLPLPLPTLFLLNGIGYLVLVTALYLPPLHQFQRQIRWLLIIFTAVTVIMYFSISGFRPNPLGLADKLVELVLIGLLLVDGRQSAPSRVGVVPQ